MEIADDLRVDTSALAMFRELATKNRQLGEVIGKILQCRIIVDANVVISDLRQKILFPERGNTALEEMMASSVLIVVAPRWLEADMNSAIPQYAESSGLSAVLLRHHWEKYKEQLVWDETYPRPVDTPLTHIDPKDAPYVFTQWLHNAIGVLSKDKHIEQMGGNRLTLDFVFSVRSYARAKVIAVTIKVGGTVIGAAAIAVIYELVKALIQVIKKIPPGVWLLLILVAVILIASPEARKWIREKFSRLKETIEPLFSGIASAVQQGAVIAQQKETEAATHLSEAQSQSRIANSVSTSRVGSRRRSRRVRQRQLRRSGTHSETSKLGE